MIDVVLIAHGSPDPRHRAGVEELAANVSVLAGPDWVVRPCYLDHHGPSPAAVAARLGRDAVAVPVLLVPAYHARVDVPQAVAQLGAEGARVIVAEPLGPHGAQLDACEELLARAGIDPSPGTAVVVFVAGSSDSAAVSRVGQTIAEHPRVGWGPWRVAALDGGRAVEEVVAELAKEADRVVAVSFMVAEGILRDRMVKRCEALGVPIAPGALGGTRALADLLVERVAGQLVLG